MNKGFRMTGEQVGFAQQALDISALNGLVSLAVMLTKRGLLTMEEGNSLYEAMIKPLSVAAVANNPVVQDAQQHLDSLFAEILKPC